MSIAHASTTKECEVYLDLCTNVSELEDAFRPFAPPASSNRIKSNRRRRRRRRVARSLASASSQDETCGGTWALSLYKLPWPLAPDGNEGFLACFRDDPDERVMADVVTLENMTVDLCRAHCLGTKSKYYATQVYIFADCLYNIYIDGWWWFCVGESGGGSFRPREQEQEQQRPGRGQ